MIIKNLIEEKNLSLKSGNHFRKNFLGLIISESSKHEKVPSDQKVIKTIKAMKESNLNVVKLLDDNDPRKKMLKDEISILEEFIPQQLTEQETKKVIQANSFISLAQAMSFFSENYPGRFDARLVRSLLSL